MQKSVATPFKTTIAASVLLAAAYALRVFQLGSAEIGGDEGFTVDFLTRSFAGIVQATFDLREPHPVGSYFVQKMWMTAAGSGEFALRMSSVVAGVLACALVIALAREVFAGMEGERSIALMAAGLVVVSAFAVRASRELRMYSWQLMFLTAAMWFAWRLWRRDRWTDALGYACAGAAAMHIHYFSATVLLVLNLFALWKAGSSWRKWLAAQALVAAAVAPWLWAVLSIVSGYPGNAEVPTAWMAVERGASALVAGAPLEAFGQQAALIAAAALLAIGIGAARARRDVRLFVAAAIVVPIFLIWLGAQARPIFREKYLMPALPGFCLAGALAWHAAKQRVGRRAYGGALVGAMLVGGFAVPTAVYFRDWIALPNDWRHLMSVLKRYDALPRGATHVLINFPDPGFSYYNGGHFPFAVMPFAPGNEAAAQQDAERLEREGVERVLLQLAPSFWDDRRIAETALSQRFVKIDETYTGRWIVQVYGRPMPERDRAVDARFASGVALESSWARLDARARLVEVQLRWSGDAAALAQGRKYFIHVVRRGDPAAMIAQHDGELTAEMLQGRPALYGLRVHDAVGDDALSGEYVVRVGVYDGEREGYPRVPLVDGADAVEAAVERSEE